MGSIGRMLLNKNRGAESSKGFMSYEIYFELEYHYLWSNCNGRSLGEKKIMVHWFQSPVFLLDYF